MSQKVTYKKHSILPGFGVTLGFTLAYLSLVVLIPLAGLLLKMAAGGWEHFWDTLLDIRVFKAFQVTFLCALAAAAINAVFGVLVAWVLVRYPFPGKRFVDAMVDLPFALPTAVAGIALTALYAENGWIGEILAQWGIKVAYTPLGIGVALVFVGLPYVVRTVEPVLQDLGRDLEEVSATLGASRLQTFCKIIFPLLLPTMLTGFAMAFARGLGEYGSVIFIAGNLPMVSEIVPLLIVTKLEQYDYTGAMALAVAMLFLSFLLLLVINLLQKWASERRG